MILARFTHAIPMHNHALQSARGFPIRVIESVVHVVPDISLKGSLASMPFYRMWLQRKSQLEISIVP
jgi:hypothetical protein